MWPAFPRIRAVALRHICRRDVIKMPWSAVKRETGGGERRDRQTDKQIRRQSDKRKGQKQIKRREKREGGKKRDRSLIHR